MAENITGQDSGVSAISSTMYKVGGDQWRRSLLRKTLGSDAISTVMYKVGGDQWQRSSLSKAL